MSKANTFLRARVKKFEQLEFALEDSKARINDAAALLKRVIDPATQSSVDDANIFTDLLAILTEGQGARPRTWAYVNKDTQL